MGVTDCGAGATGVGLRKENAKPNRHAGVRQTKDHLVSTRCTASGASWGDIVSQVILQLVCVVCSVDVE